MDHTDTVPRERAVERLLALCRELLSGHSTERVALDEVTVVPYHTVEGG